MHGKDSRNQLQSSYDYSVKNTSSANQSKAGQKQKNEALSLQFDELKAQNLALQQQILEMGLTNKSPLALTTNDSTKM
jgi:hypothetical protein